MAIENFTEVQEYLTANNIEGNEVKTYLDGFRVQPTLEQFKGLTNTNADYRAFMDSENDKHTTKSLDTWKTNNLGKYYSDRYEKEHPSEDPEKLASQLKYKELEDRLNASESKSIKQELKNSAFAFCQTNVDVDGGLIDIIMNFNGENLIETLKSISEKNILSVNNGINEKLKGNTPKTGSGKVEVLTKEEFNKMPYKERTKLYNENPELYQELNK